MYCKNCGMKLDDDANYCPRCGTNQQSAGGNSYASAETCAANGVNTEKKPPKVWTIFSRVGKILGIACVATALIPYLNLFSLDFGIVGIVLSCLGKKAKTEETDNDCRIGLILSIIAVAVSFVMIIIYTVVFELAILGIY